MATTSPNELGIGYAEIVSRFGISQRTIRRMIIANRFPQPINLPTKRKTWAPETVEKFFAEAKRGVKTKAAISV